MANQRLLQIFPSEEEAGRVKRQITGHEEIELNDRPRSPLRVAEKLRNADPGSYNPKIVSFGPYRASNLDQEFKVKVAADFWAFGVHGDDLSDDRLDEMVQTIQHMREAIASFYDCPIPQQGEGEYCMRFALMMMVDAAFILHFFYLGYNHENAVDINCDILKLENQIPLSVLTSVLSTLSEGFLGSDDFIRRVFNTSFLPFEIHVPPVQNEIHVPPVQNEEPHLLAAIHTAVSLRIQFGKPGEELHTPFQIICYFLQVHLVENLCRIFFLSSHKRNAFPIKGYTASELARAGIKFKLVTSSDEHICFDKYSHSLYLPRITVTNPLTEVLFRNLCAFEHICAFEPNNTRGNHVRNFIQLMACLIDNSRDVATLKNSDVICLEYSSNIHEAHLVQMWKGFSSDLKSVSTESEPPAELKEELDKVLNRKRCMIKCRIAISESFKEYKALYLTKPWKVVALLVGIFILVMTAIQGYCSLRECKSTGLIENSKIRRAKWGS